MEETIQHLREESDRGNSIQRENVQLRHQIQQMHQQVSLTIPDLRMDMLSQRDSAPVLPEISPVTQTVPTLNIQREINKLQQELECLRGRSNDSQNLSRNF